MMPAGDEAAAQLARIFEVILAEVRCNPDLANRIERAIGGVARARARRANR
jgi:hypothetical protein